MLYDAVDRFGYELKHQVQIQLVGLTWIKEEPINKTTPDNENKETAQRWLPKTKKS